MGQLGTRPFQIFENLTNDEAERLLPPGAFKLINALDPERINSSSREETLGNILSLELAVDDPQRRKLLLSSLPVHKVGELENRIEVSIDQLRQKNELEKPLRRAILGFFGFPTVADTPTVFSEALETVLPKRGLFPSPKTSSE